MDAVERMRLEDRIATADEGELRAMLAGFEAKPGLGELASEMSARKLVGDYEGWWREPDPLPPSVSEEVPPPVIERERGGGTTVSPATTTTTTTKRVVYDLEQVEAARNNLRRLDEKRADREAAAEAVRSRLRHLERVAAAEYRDPGESPLTALRRSYEED